MRVKITKKLKQQKREVELNVKGLNKKSRVNKAHTEKKGSV